MYIYKTTNTINGKIYIGQCVNKVSKSKWYLGSGSTIAKAIIKYGKHNFTKEILKDNIPTQTLLDAWEAIFIKKFDACNDKIGYNIISGAAFGLNHLNPATLAVVKAKISEAKKGHIVTQETRNKISKSKIGTKHTESAKAKISVAMAGVNHPHYGKKFSKEYRKKLSLAHKKLWQ